MVLLSLSADSIAVAPLSGYCKLLDGQHSLLPPLTSTGGLGLALLSSLAQRRRCKVRNIVTKLAQREALEQVDCVFEQSAGRSTEVVRLDDGRAPLASAGVDKPITDDGRSCIELFSNL